METIPAATDWAMVLLRFSHYAFGVLWLSVALFSAFIMGFAVPTLEPPVRGQVMGAFVPRIMPVAAVSATWALISGLWLFKATYLGESGIGLAHARGSWAMMAVSLGILMFLLAFAVAMPASIRMGKEQKAGNMAAVGPLMARVTLATRGVALLAFPAIFSMMLAAGHMGVEFSAGAACAVLAAGAAVFGLMIFIATRKKG